MIVLENIQPHNNIVLLLHIHSILLLITYSKQREECLQLTTINIMIVEVKEQRRAQ